MGIVLKDDQQYKVTTTRDMKAGDFAVVIDGDLLGHILFRNNDCAISKLINLTRVNSWTGTPEFNVRILPPGTSFQIE